MLKPIDVWPTLTDAFLKAVAVDSRAEKRIERIWYAICNAEYADNVYPMDQFLSVLAMLGETGQIVLSRRGRKYLQVNQRVDLDSRASRVLEYSERR